MTSFKKIYLLIGPKGSGKSYLGALFEKHFHIPFLRVEEWVLSIAQGQNIFDEAYVKKVFETIETGIDQHLQQQDTAVFESTGLSRYFDRMLSRLQSRYQVITIGVVADQMICIQRVKTRDASIHIPVSDQQLEEINQQVNAKSLACDFQIFNDLASDQELVEHIKKIIQQTQ